MEYTVLFNFPIAGMLAFLIVPYFIGQIALQRYRKKSIAAYAHPLHFSTLLIERSPLLTYTKMIGWTIVWLLLCLALMEPFGNLRYSSPSPHPLGAAQNRTAPHEMIFLIDTSASMGVMDGYNGQSRLETAKEIMEDLVKQLRGQTISVYAFTSELTPVVPPTLDYLFTRLAIKDLHIDQGDVGGTRLAPILSSLSDEIFPKGSSKRYTVLMFSDGGDTELATLTGREKEKEKEAILKALPNPEESHLRLLTIGLGGMKEEPIPHVSFEGKPVLSKLEPDILQLLASREKGRYYMANALSSLDLEEELLNQLNHMTGSDATTPQQEKTVAMFNKEELIMDLYYQIPLGLALLFYFLTLLLPDVRR